VIINLIYQKGEKAMERLTEKVLDSVLCDEDLQKVIHKLADYEDTGLTPEEIKELQKDYDRAIGEYNNIQGKLLDYERAEEQGLLINLPKAINDNSIYYIDESRELHYGYIEQYVISEMGYSFLYINSDNEWDKEFTEHDIGKTVFLTREAAEAALKGSEGK
jgi:hypothetical protein